MSWGTQIQAHGLIHFATLHFKHVISKSLCTTSADHLVKLHWIALNYSILHALTDLIYFCCWCCFCKMLPQLSEKSTCPVPQKCDTGTHSNADLHCIQPLMHTLVQTVSHPKLNFYLQSSAKQGWFVATIRFLSHWRKCSKHVTNFHLRHNVLTPKKFSGQIPN